MAVDLSSLIRAVDRLEEGLARYQQDVSDAQIRDGLIQRFEFTYDLAIKMLRRVLSETGDSLEEIDTMTFPSLIRTGWELGVVPGGWLAWESFRKLRNQTSHTYDEVVALKAVAEIPKFLAEVKAVADLLARRLGQ